jgi:hypothetical protein
MAGNIATRGGPALGAIGLGGALVSFALPIIGVPTPVAWITLGVGCSLIIAGGLWWYQARHHRNPDASSLKDLLVSELKDAIYSMHAFRTPSAETKPGMSCSTRSTPGPLRSSNFSISGRRSI